MGKLTSLVNVESGPIGDVVLGLGTGTLANVADKKLLQGKLTGMGIGLGFSINGRLVTLNLTDVVTYLAINKFSLKFTTKKIFATLISLGAKKFFELNDYIDPPHPGEQPTQEAPLAPLAQYNPNFGGLTHG